MTTEYQKQRWRFTVRTQFWDCCVFLKTGRKFYVRKKPQVKTCLRICRVRQRVCVALFLYMHGGRESTHVYVCACTVVKPDLNCAKTMWAFQKEAGRGVIADLAFYPEPSGRKETRSWVSPRELTILSSNFLKKHTSNHQVLSEWHLGLHSL